MDLLRRTGSGIPPTAKLIAIGRATALALESRGLGGVLHSGPRSTSEDLLESGLLQHVDRARVLIVRGQGGRELLAEGLRARGAEVEYAEVYERRASAGDFSPILTRWLGTRCPMLVLTSDFGARILFERTPAGLRERMLEAPLALLSERQRESCREMGWRGPVGVCDTTGDDGLMDALLKLFETHCRQESR
jgi:uroporphyrinogen-III synthase